MKNLSFIGIFILLFLFIAQAYAVEVPKLQGYVNDYAAMISPAARARIEQELSAFEKTDSTQVVILTIPSLEGGVIEEFAIKAAEAWKIGQKGKDNGIILVVAKQEKKIRIEVGRGLEGKLTDLMSGRIIDLVIKPRFKRGDFDGGFLAGTSALIDASRGEFKAGPAQRRPAHNNSSRMLTFLIIGAVVIAILGSISKPLGGLAGAVGLPALGTLLFSSFSPFLLAGLAIGGFLLGILLPSLLSGGGGGIWPGGGYYGGGFGGGSSGSGGGSDFGGGGGGDFGGGGASGGWD